jgi:uridylate kinase
MVGLPSVGWDLGSRVPYPAAAVLPLLAHADLVDLVRGEVELISGVRLVPALRHTTDDRVVTFGSGSWQAIFLTDTILAC